MSKIFTTMKLVILLCATTNLLLIKTWWIIVLFFTAVLGLALLLKSRNLLTLRFHPLIVMAFFIILFQLVFNYQVDLQTRFFLGGINAIKITALSLLAFIFTATTSLSSIIEILSFLPKSLLIALTISFGIIPAVLDEARKITLAQNARGLNTHTLNIFKSILPLIIPLLHRSLKRAEQIAMVLTTRGYH